MTAPELSLNASHALRVTARHLKQLLTDSGHVWRPLSHADCCLELIPVCSRKHAARGVQEAIADIQGHVDNPRPVRVVPKRVGQLLIFWRERRLATARLAGRLMLGLNYYAVLESFEGEAAGLAWRVYRK